MMAPLHTPLAIVATQAMRHNSLVAPLVDSVSAIASISYSWPLK